MKNHNIICGSGRVGSKIAEMFRKNKTEFIIIEKDMKNYEFLKREGYNVMKGNAMDEDTLIKADIANAKWILVCLGNDADNLFIIFKAKDLNPKVKTAARVSEEESLESFYKAGIDLVVIPEIIGGIQIAKSVLGMDEVDKLQTILKKKKGGLYNPRYKP